MDVLRSQGSGTTVYSTCCSLTGHSFQIIVAFSVAILQIVFCILSVSIDKIDIDYTEYCFGSSRSRTFWNKVLSMRYASSSRLDLQPDNS